MQQVLQNLIMALRASGVRISVSENIDAMKTYLPYCSIVQKCTTVRHLERVVGSLLRTRAV